MSDLVKCDEHDEQPATFVCSHLMVSLQQQKAYGFNWLRDEEGSLQAFCDACKNMTQQEWEQQENNLPKVLCERCFMEIASLNNIQVR